MRLRPVLAFLLLGTSLLLLSGGSRPASCTDEVVLLPTSPHTLTAPPSSHMSDNVMECACGKKYTSDSHFSRHQNNCEILLRDARRSWDIADARHKKRPRLDSTRHSSASSSKGTRPHRKTARAGKSGTDRTIHGQGTSSAAASSSHNRYESLAPDDDLSPMLDDDMVSIMIEHRCVYVLTCPSRSTVSLTTYQRQIYTPQTFVLHPPRRLPYPPNVCAGRQPKPCRRWKIHCQKGPAHCTRCRRMKRTAPALGNR